MDDFNNVYVKNGGGEYVGNVVGVIDISTINFKKEHKTQCPKCEIEGRDNSSDNLHVYAPVNKEYSGAYCFACGFAVPSFAELRRTTTNKKPTSILTSMFTQENTNVSNEKLSSITSDDYVKLREKRLTQDQVNEIIASTNADPKNKRRMNKDISDKYGVRYVYDADGKVAEMLTPVTVNEDGGEVVVGFKRRIFPKDYSKATIGYVGKLNSLIGKSACKSPKTLIIVAGEIDLVTADHLLKVGMQKYPSHYNDINIVTAPLGENSTVDFLRNDHEWVMKHNKIILCLDNDSAGKKATQECVDLLGEENVLVANLSYKDVNDYINPENLPDIKDYARQAQLFCQDTYWNAKPVVDYGIVGSGDLFDAAVEKLKQEKIKLPEFLVDLGKAFTDGALGRGEWVNIISNTSTGKSTIVDAWLNSWCLSSDYRQAILSFEADTKSYGLKMSSLVVNRNINQIEGYENRLAYIEKNKAQIMSFLKRPDGTDRFLFIEKIPNTAESFKKMVLSLVRLHNVACLWIDPFVNLRAMVKTDKEFDDLIIFLDRVRMEYDLTIICVVHTRKSLASGQIGSNGGAVNEEDAFGSRALISAATVNLTLSRDKSSEDDVVRNTTYISIRKNRSDSITGTNLAAVFYRRLTNKLYPYSVAEQHGFFKDDIFNSGFDVGGYDVSYLTDVDNDYEGDVSYISESSPPPIIPIDNLVVEGVADI